MPPKKQPTSNELTEKNIAIIRAALCSLDEFKPNWAYVLHAFGLGKGGYGPRDFKAAIQKMDLEFKDGKISSTTGAQTDNNNNNNPAGPAFTKPETSKKSNGAATNKRKKGGAKKEESDEDDGDATKKVKVDDDDESDF